VIPQGLGLSESPGGHGHNHDEGKGSGGRARSAACVASSRLISMPMLVASELRSRQRMRAAGLLGLKVSRLRRRISLLTLLIIHHQLCMCDLATSGSVIAKQDLGEGRGVRGEADAVRGAHGRERPDTPFQKGHEPALPLCRGGVAREHLPQRRAYSQERQQFGWWPPPCCLCRGSSCS
jgi:hypothetical protein